MRPVYVLSAARTPIGKFGGAFASRTPADLGEAAAKAAIERSGLPASAIDETIFGHARQAGRRPEHRAAGLAPRRRPRLRPGLHRQQGVRVVAQGAHARRRSRSPRARTISCWPAGPSACRRRPICSRARGSATGWATTELVDAMYRDGFLCPLCGQLMGETAENLAREYGILRDEQDAYALGVAAAGRARPSRRARSTTRSCRSRSRGGREASTRRRRTSTPAPTRRSRRSRSCRRSSIPENGTVHAGNSSGITDGAAALVLASEEEVEKSGVEPLARIARLDLGRRRSGPHGDRPVPAVRAVLAEDGPEALGRGSRSS